MGIKTLIEKSKTWLVVGEVRYLSNSVDSQERIAKLMLLAFVCLLAFEPSIAAASDQPWDDVAQKVKTILQGPLVTALATIGVVALGIMAIAGKLAWDTAIKVIIGITLIFGATKLVTFFSTAAGLAAA